jgi:putative transposase
VKFVFVAAEKALYPVRLLCEVLGVKASGYYAWVDRPASRQKIADAHPLVEIKAAMVRGRGTYGSPRVLRELRAHGTAR